MARMVRVVLPGVPHHVTQRGSRRQRTQIVKDDYRAVHILKTRSHRVRDLAQLVSNITGAAMSAAGKLASDDKDV